MKTCNTCKVGKPFEEFYKHKKAADGCLPRCKDCHRAAMRVLYFDKMKDEDWRERELDRHRKKAAKAREEGKISPETIATVSRKAWQQRNKEKRLAHSRVAHALASGRLKKLPCNVCGDTNSHGHHEDYTKPLEVVWLCPRHHADRHLEINRERRAEKYRTAL